MGLCTAVLTAQQGGIVKLCQLISDDDQNAAERFFNRYKVDVTWVSAETNKGKAVVLKDADVVICAAKAGVRVLEKEELDHAEQLQVVADTNLVPPTGVEGIGTNDKFIPVELAKSTFWGIGSMAIGNLKYKTQYGLCVKMQ